MAFPAHKLDPILRDFPRSHRHSGALRGATSRSGYAFLKFALAFLTVSVLIGCGSAEPKFETAAPSTSTTDDALTVPTTATSRREDSIRPPHTTTPQNTTPQRPTTEPIVKKRSSNFTLKQEIERHPNGKVRRGYEARFYPDGEMVFHGRYVEFWESGKKHSKGRYEDGNKEGEWIYWYPNGRIAKKGGFINGKLEGRWVYVTEDGRPKHRDHYKDGKRHGELIVFDKATGTKVVRKVIFKDGVKHGIATEYFSNGNVMRTTNYENGVENGKQETFYDSGNKMMVEEFKDGKLNGSVTKWSPLGSVQSEVVYVNGVPTKKK